LLSSSPLVGMLLIIAMLTSSTSVKVKAAVSLLAAAVVPSSQNGALALPDLVPMLVVVVVHALLTPDLTAASGSILLPTTIARTPTVTTTLDFPA